MGLFRPTPRDQIPPRVASKDVNQWEPVDVLRPGDAGYDRGEGTCVSCGPNVRAVYDGLCGSCI